MTKSRKMSWSDKWKCSAVDVLPEVGMLLPIYYPADYVGDKTGHHSITSPDSMVSHLLFMGHFYQLRGASLAIYGWNRQISLRFYRVENPPVSVFNTWVNAIDDSFLGNANCHVQSKNESN